MVYRLELHQIMLSKLAMVKENLIARYECQTILFKVKYTIKVVQ